MTDTIRCTAFDGARRIASGPLAEVALAVKHAADRDPAARILVFDDVTSRPVEIDLRGSEADVLARLVPPGATASAAPEAPRGPGRPKLGVVSREVTLLPRHWDWLARQRGGASVTLRRLVDEARRADDRQGGRRQAEEAAYRFMAAMAGDLPHFEDAARALFAQDRERFETRTEAWPADIRDHARRLAAVAFGDAGQPAARLEEAP